MLGLLDIRVPVIAAVNGPATIHGELALLCDIVLCSPNAIFQETHFSIGVVPGDGIPARDLADAARPPRGRYHLYTGRQSPRRAGARVGKGQRGRRPGSADGARVELARHIVDRPPLTVKHTRALLVQETKRRLQEALPYGLALEGLGSGGLWPGVSGSKQARSGS